MPVNVSKNLGNEIAQGESAEEVSGI